MATRTKKSSVPRGNTQQWIESRGGRDVTVTSHPVRAERVEFLNEPADPTAGPLTLKFYLGPGHSVDEHTHPKQTETLTVTAGKLRATIDGEESILEVGDSRRVPPGTPHGYDVVSDEEAVLAVSMTPALAFKEFVIAEHGLAADAYPENGLNLPYFGVVTNRYGPMIAPPQNGLATTILGATLPTIGRLRGLQIPDEPLPVRTVADQ